MRKTVLILTEQRASVSEEEARAIIQRCVSLWLKRALRNHDSL